MFGPHPVGALGLFLVLYTGMTLDNFGRSYTVPRSNWGQQCARQSTLTSLLSLWPFKLYFKDFCKLLKGTSYINIKIHIISKRFY